MSALSALTEPKPKKFCRLHIPSSLPIELKKDGRIKIFNSKFNGFSVVVDENIDDMKKIISMGSFGKANLSRSFPQHCSLEILRKRQYDRRKKWTNLSNNKSMKKVLVVPDSDSETEEYFTNLKPQYQIDSSGVKETLWLSLEEAFFLANEVQCLNVQYENRILGVEEMWSIFSDTEPLFPRNYAVYFYYRSKNWVVKPGIKFGGDYLLYKQGPAYYHASYVVVIQVVNDTGQTNERLTNRKVDNTSLQRLSRLCETASKELLICKLCVPEGIKITYNNLDKLSIQEIIMKRWVSTQERDNKTV